MTVSHSFQIAVLQFNPVVGDIVANAQAIVKWARRAYADGARVVLTPELSLTGYPPEDWLLRPAFLAACDQQLNIMAQTLADLPDLYTVIGHPQHLQGPDIRTHSLTLHRLVNSASVIHQGRVIASYAKRELPNYQVFDERRYFVSGREAGLGPGVFDVQGTRCGILICEDAWFDEPAQASVAAGAELLLVLNASPFHLKKATEREERMANCARSVQRPLVYAHMVGGQDELIFDGASFALQADGSLAARAASFETQTLVVNWDARSKQLQGAIAPLPSLESQAWQALVMGVRDYIGKNRFPGVLLGLSGGIDSALVLAIAVDALGADKVRTVMMPSPYTADISWIDARDMAQRLNVRYDEIDIAPMFDAFKTSLASEFAERAEDTTEENIQARIRGTLLMALSNKFGSLVLTTGNKSEMSTGYCTLYGDMAGGFAVLKDVAKTLVYRLAQWRNEQGPTPVIPERIITRPPSAELRPDQTDQDSLPPYDVLDGIMQRYMEEDQSIDEIIAAGYERHDVERITRLLKINEYKRRQSPVGIRITHRSFGKDWRYPITSGFRA